MKNWINIFMTNILPEDAKYELVNPIAGRFFISCNPRPRGITHSNFEAKLKNDPEAEVQLFFLEIVGKAPGLEKVTCCCSLGRSGSKAAATGLHGCRVCSKINHPKRMRFITH
ncbi:uncharacterized protein LOC141594005 isoform X2 [Silene latifolia]|uniref:uncharacterized protein LOC141594005 isoform X2 n=1 Tax=Silene latifolia TaxID=37657 RepID=UPI003D782118